VMTETARLEVLLDKYKFTSPVSEALRKRLMKSRARVLKSTLKEVGAYSLWFGFVLFILLKLRNIGFKFAITIANIAAITATVLASGAVVSGAYFVIKQYQGSINTVSIEEKSDAFDSAKNTDNALSDTREQLPLPKDQEKAPIYEIFLYNGKKYIGSIESRGMTYKISTSSGQVSIPAKQIKLIRRANE
jgi:hypothetical protein